MANNQLIEKIFTNIEEYKKYDFFSKLNDSIFHSNSQASINGHFLKQEIDITWIKAIEDCIIPLDNIIRSPRRFIKNDEDIVPIALARGITTDSIKHLAQHTNMIQSVEDDTVTPNRILEVRKEESFSTYENRFIYTLLTKLQYFLDKRMGIINEKTGTNNEYDINYSGTFDFDKDKINYQISFNYQIPNKTDLADISKLVQQDVSSLTTLQRIERLRKILYDFQASQFMKKLIGAPLIRPPLTMTNLLSKNPDYRACVDLWMFVENYRGTGVKLNVVDRQENPGEDLADKFSSMTAVFYTFLRNYTSGLQDIKVNEIEEKKIVTEKIEQILNTYDFEIDEVKRIFQDRIEKKQKRIFAYEKRMLAIIKEAIADEKVERIKREERLKQARLEQIRLEKEKAKLENKEKLKQLEEERKAFLEEKRKKEEEYRLAKLEQQRLEKEKLAQEKIALQKEKEIEKQRILEEKKIARETERLAKLEEQRILNEKIALEKLELQRQKEAERLAKLEEQRIQEEKLEQEKLEQLIQEEARQKALLEERLKQEEIERQAKLEEQRIQQEKLELERLEIIKQIEAKKLAILEEQRIQKEKLEKERLELIKQIEAKKQAILEQKLKSKEKAKAQLFKVNSVMLKNNKNTLPDQVIVNSIKPVSIAVKPLKPLSNEKNNYDKMARLRALKQVKNNLTNTKVVQSNVNNNIEVKPIKFMTNQEKMAHVRSFKKS